MERTFPYLLLPHIWASRNRARRRERGDLTRAALFGGIAVAVCGALFQGAAWLTGHLLDYEELGDYLLRVGLSWVFLTFLSFLAFSGIVTALSTFFLAEDLRILVVAPVESRRLFHARFLRTLVQSSWMVIIFVVPVLLGVGWARCASPTYYATALLTVVPFAVIPVAVGTGITLLLVNVFPARRARDILLLMGLLFAASVVIVLRFIRPERLIRVESLPDVTDFFATLQSPITPMLPSFWAGETIFASLVGGTDLVHAAALWTTALASIVILGFACERWHFSGYSRSQEAPRARFTHFRALDAIARVLPLSVVRRQLLIRDLKIFLRDVTQWSQLLLLLALVLLYLYNFSVLDLQRIPSMSGFLKNVYALVNLGMAGLVMATVTVRFVFPAISAEGAAFWIIRTSPISLRDFVWSKFWTGLVPVLFLTELLTVTANEFLSVDPLLKVMSALAIVLMSFALVGRAIAMGARYPRFGGDPSQVAGSFGGVAFMMQAVLFVIVIIVLLGWPASVYLLHQVRGRALPAGQQFLMGTSVLSAVVLGMTVWLTSMRSGVRALTRMGE
jgi:ABC-2 type transport system permease protein